MLGKASKSEYTFKVGDTVEWTSQSQGVVKEKVGVIYAVVPEFINPKGFLPEKYNQSQIKFDLKLKEHKRYIISVMRLYGKKVDYYCPWPSDLRLVKEAPHE